MTVLTNSLCVVFAIIGVILIVYGFTALFFSLLTGLLALFFGIILIYVARKIYTPVQKPANAEMTEKENKPKEVEIKPKEIEIKPKKIEEVSKKTKVGYKWGIALIILGIFLLVILSPPNISFICNEVLGNLKMTLTSSNCENELFYLSPTFTIVSYLIIGAGFGLVIVTYARK